MRKRNIALFSLAFLLFACEQSVQAPSIQTIQQGIHNGEVDTLVEDRVIGCLRNEGDFSCSATLITPRFVLTAAHCVVHDFDSQQNPIFDKSIGFGASCANPEFSLSVKRVIIHPQYQVNFNFHDIALLELEQPAPVALGKPIAPLPPVFAPSPEEIAQGVVMRDVGYGLTEKGESGTKRHAKMEYQHLCPLDDDKVYCVSYGLKRGCIYALQQKTGIGGGDSGGPTIYEKDGMRYVAGVHAFSTATVGVQPLMDAGSTYVPFYYDDFIVPNVTDLSVEPQELCDNGFDDNYDALIDCGDPQCSKHESCIKEICDNKIDDNGDNFADCADVLCMDSIVCQTEICDNQADDNGDTIIDCASANCYTHVHCRKEICDNAIDDDGNGLMDCKDPACAKALVCTPEICNNLKDDDNNNLVDCADPVCYTHKACRTEICDNALDDDADTLVDCADAGSCILHPNCRNLACTNGYDDNFDGLLDCKDPLCADVVSCREEICNNEVDDNENGKVDCDEDSCAQDEACKPSHNDEACSTQMLISSSPNYWLFAMIFGFVLWRRKRRV